MTERHVVWHAPLVSREDRSVLNRHKSCVVWFTGLSASGKSTIAHLLERELFDRRVRSYVIDGDNIRHGINSNLGFSREDRHENLRRIAEVTKLFVDGGLVVLAAFISPFNSDREFVKEIIGPDDFIEVYVKCNLDTCEKRDPKGLYKKARAGVIKNYTGIDQAYEEPDNPAIVIDTDNTDAIEAVRIVMRHLESHVLNNPNEEKTASSTPEP